VLFLDICAILLGIYRRLNRQNDTGHGHLSIINDKSVLQFFSWECELNLDL
jgi:hypothetical protein